ncbi:MAG: hypothetical protein QOK43_1982 [Acidimicrobiaceae bacterium]|nr:hypothetical protein [Acidimicrobiaceae bacterium]
MKRIATAILTVTLLVSAATHIGAASADPRYNSDPLGGLPLACSPATGHVTDPWGQGLGGVTVAWAANNHQCPGSSVTTDANGFYSVPLEVSTTPSLIRVYSTWTTEQTRLIMPDTLETGTSHDFQMLYSLNNASVSPGFARTGVTVTAATRSQVPHPSPLVGAKVIVEWPGGGQLTMTADPVDFGGWTQWHSGRVVAATDVEGDQTVRMCAVRAASSQSCAGAAASGDLVSTIANVHYVIDNTAPDTIGARIWPLSGGNVLTSTNAPLAIRVTDTGSGVPASQVSFALTDQTSGTTVNYPATVQSGSWYRSAPQSYVVGHLYSVAATVSDRSGNTVSVAQAPMEQGGGFLAVSVTNLASTARSSASSTTRPCSVGDIDTSTLTRQVTCTGVQVDFASVPVTLSGSRHPGVAYLKQSTSLASLHIHPTTQGIGQSDVVPLPSGTQAANLRFAIGGRNDAPVTTASDPATVVLPTITATVSAAVDAATIDMPPTQTVATSMACQLPGATAWCSPDPLPPVVDGGDQPVQDVIALPGGMVMATLSGGASAFVGPYGTLATRQVAVTHPSTGDEAVVEYQADSGHGTVEDIVELWRAFKTAGWDPAASRTMLDRFDAGEGLDAIGHRVEAGEYTTALSTAPGGPTPPAGDYWVDGCIDETEVHMQNFHGRGCWTRYVGQKDANGRWLGDKSYALAKANTLGEMDKLTSAHHYTTGEIRSWSPTGHIDTDCHDVTVSASGFGMSFSETQPICADQIEPDLKRLLNGKGDSMETTWSSSRSTAAAQNTEQADLLYVPNAPSGHPVPSGFTYHLRAHIVFHGCFLCFM